MEHKNKTIYLLPNLITTTALLFGFYAILAAINEDFHRAAICIFIAMLLDGLDGRVARLTGTESEFGEQYDSLADMLSFGVSPAIVIYLWSISSIEQIYWIPNKLSWMIPFIYCACAALRLAKFNTMVGTGDPKYFIGLPSPSAAGVVVGFVWLGVEYEFAGSAVAGVSLFLTLFAGIMMVSPINYFSFKKVDLHGRVHFLWVGLIIIVLAIISINPATVLWSIFMVFALHGPVLYLINFYKSRKSTR